MLGYIVRLAAALSLAGMALAATVSQTQASPPASTHATTGSETSVPYGWVDFCERYSGECVEETRVPRDIELTPAAWRKISRINEEVNRTVAPVSDKEHWGAVDSWDYPSDLKGDCEDYALLKRRQLIAAGFPREALLLTVVKEPDGDGHSVLTLRTDHGDYVLDNLSDEVMPWTRTPYRFVKRQAQENQNIWVAIGEAASAPAYAANDRMATRTLPRKP
jgi:predicted transglutaminase-like cysteine proteinase